MDPNIQSTFHKPPINAKRQQPNLHTILTSSKKHLHKTQHKGNYKCNKPRCLVCKHIITDCPFTIPHTDIKIQPPNLTCDSSNIIYLIFCNKCNNSKYIGETQTPFRFRFNNHKLTIRQTSPYTPIARHFNQPEHTLDNMKCILIDNNFATTQIRKQKEIKWIIKLNTLKNGLNTDLGILNTYKYFHTSHT